MCCVLIRMHILYALRHYVYYIHFKLVVTKSTVNYNIICSSHIKFGMLPIFHHAIATYIKEREALTEHTKKNKKW